MYDTLHYLCRTETLREHDVFHTMPTIHVEETHLYILLTQKAKEVP